MYMDAHARENLTAMIFGGLFERYPDLKLGVMEMVRVGCLFSCVGSIAATWLSARLARGPKSLATAWRRRLIRQNVFFGFQDEDLGVEFREFIGTDNLVYANDYPHSDCVWPRSRQVLERIFTTAGCTEQEKAKLAGGNAARVFGFDATGPG